MTNDDAQRDFNPGHRHPASGPCSWCAALNDDGSWRNPVSIDDALDDDDIHDSFDA